VLDSDHRDYHAWNAGEIGYYNRWAVETHRVQHREFREPKPHEQREYWDWRHFGLNPDRDREEAERLGLSSPSNAQRFRSCGDGMRTL
jgi:hypothetical protein